MIYQPQRETNEISFVTIRDCLLMLSAGQVDVERGAQMMKQQCLQSVCALYMERDFFFLESLY
jgi:hypothetical protein